MRTLKSTSALPLAFVIPRLSSGVSSSPGSSFPRTHTSGPNPKVSHEREAQQFSSPAGGVSVRGAGGGSGGKLAGSMECTSQPHLVCSRSIHPARRAAGSGGRARTQCSGALRLLVHCFLSPRYRKAILGKEGRAANASGSLSATAPRKKAP